MEEIVLTDIEINEFVWNGNFLVGAVRDYINIMKLSEMPINIKKVTFESVKQSDMKRNPSIANLSSGEHSEYLNGKDWSIEYQYKFVEEHCVHSIVISDASKPAQREIIFSLGHQQAEGEK